MLVTGLTGVKAERDENNQPLDHDAPPVMLQQLVTLRSIMFIQKVLDKYRDCLQKFWTFDEFEEIEADHRDLVKMYHDDENMRNVINKHDVNTLFNDAWDCVPRFKRLRAFCGGLATIFPNTTSVESDFSILKWELDAFRTALMHLSLEVIMQSNAPSSSNHGPDEPSNTHPAVTRAINQKRLIWTHPQIIGDGVYKIT
jgi:hypothetical protein